MCRLGDRQTNVRSNCCSRSRLAYKSSSAVNAHYTKRAVSPLIYDDPGTDDSTPNSDKESDNSTDTTKTADTIFIEDKLVSTDKTTLADGTVITDSVNNDDTDQITDHETDQTGDNHTDTSGAGGANEKTSDDNTFDDEYTGSDNYSNNDNFSATIVTPVVGGTITISDGENLIINNGIAGETDSAVGEDNTANPAVDNETDTTDVTNTDQGTDKTTDSLSLIVTDPTTGVVTQITGGDTNTDIFTDDDEVDVTDTTPAGSTKDTESIQAHAKSGDSYVDQSSLSLSVKGSPSPGVTIDFLNMPGSIDTGFNTDDDELPQATAGNGTETDTFSSGDTDLVTDSGHLNISDVVNTDDGNGNTVSISESDNTIFGIAGTGTISNSDSGQEVVVDVNGHKTADTEGDTDTFAADIDPFSNETTNANNKAVTVDPKTGLKTTTTYNDNGSTDHIQERDTDGFTDIHSASLTNPGTDVDSGTAGITDQEQTNTNINCEVDLSGSMPTGGTVSLMNKFLLKANSQDTVSFRDVLATNGTNTDTTSLSGTFNVTDLYDSLSGTISTTTPSTGVTTTETIRNAVEANASDKVTDSDTTVIQSNGTKTHTPANGDTGQSKEAWSLNKITSQSSASGNQIGVVVISTDTGTDSQTELNGTETDQGVTDSSTTTTSPAGSAPPSAPPVPPPGTLSRNIWDQMTGAEDDGGRGGGNPPPPQPPANPQAVAPLVAQSVEFEAQYLVNTSFQSSNRPNGFYARCMACHGTGIIDNPALTKYLSDELQMTVGAWYHKPSFEYKLVSFITLTAPGQAMEAGTGVLLAGPTLGGSYYLVVDAASSAAGSLDDIYDGDISQIVGTEDVDFVGVAWRRGGTYLFGDEFGPTVGAGGRLLAPLAIAAGPSAASGASRGWIRLQGMADETLIGARGAAPSNELDHGDTAFLWIKRAHRLGKP